jgi:predicted secreted acid phosphatase
LPITDNAHLFLRQTTSSKEERRQNIAATNSIVMLLGDNLGDFSYLFDKITTVEPTKNVNAVAC